jgi:hypothetical protein
MANAMARFRLVGAFHQGKAAEFLKLKMGESYVK